MEYLQKDTNWSWWLSQEGARLLQNRGDTLWHLENFVPCAFIISENNFKLEREKKRTKCSLSRV